MTLACLAIAPRLSSSNPSLQNIPKRHRLVSQLAQLPGGVVKVRALCDALRAPAVDDAVREHQAGRRHHTGQDEAELQRVAEDVARFVAGAVEVGRHCCGVC